MTICDTTPAIGAAVSNRAIPVRATLNEIRCGARARSGGKTVAETAIAPLTLWPCAHIGATASAARITASERHTCKVERFRVFHSEPSATQLLFELCLRAGTASRRSTTLQCTPVWTGRTTFSRRVTTQFEKDSLRVGQRVSVVGHRRFNRRFIGVRAAANSDTLLATQGATRHLSLLASRGWRLTETRAVSCGYLLN
jgi:hypothetical protein